MLKKIIVLFSILILVLLSWIYSNFIFIKPSNYDRELYSVVIYNSTNDNLKNVIISYYKFDEKPEEFTCV